jgi:tetratricopeptide (TPR) repeat protein
MKQSLSKRMMSAGLVALLPGILLGQGLDGSSTGLSPEKELEVQFATKLLELGLADYSDRVIKKANLPTTVIEMLQLQTLCALGKFDEAKAMIGKRADKDSAETWSLKVVLADGYFAWGRYGEAQGIYNGFFSRFSTGPSEPMKQFYLTSAYKYAQMQLRMGNPKGAIAAYDMALKVKLNQDERHIGRQIMGEKAELLIKLATESQGAERKGYLNAADPIIKKLLWVQDLWFGKAIVMMAHAMVLNGQIEKATELIEKYNGELTRIDEALKQEAAETGTDLSKLSPMAQCRYMLGVILHDEAKKLLAAGGDRNQALTLLIGADLGNRRTNGALQHFLNVFVRYPNTSWAPDAGSRFQEIKELLQREFGKTVQVDISAEQWAAVERSQFAEARSLFNQKQFEAATDAYIQVLNLFPEQESSISALGELAGCYIELDEGIMVDMIVRYLSERFCRNHDYMVKAGDQVVKIAFTYTERDQQERADAIYTVFFRYFKQHPRTPAELFRYGEAALRAGDLDHALGYYQQIKEDHGDKPIAEDALSKMAHCYSLQQNYTNQITALNALVELLKVKERPGHKLVNAQFRFAGALSDYGRAEDKPPYVELALKQYKAIEKLLGDPEARGKYQNSVEEGKANDMILQGSMFYRAMTDAQRKTVPENVQDAYNKKYKRAVPPDAILQVYKKGAIKILEDLVSRFPESKFAPAALSQIGTLYTVLGDSDAAGKALKQLQDGYPESDEAKNARYMIGTNLLKLGLRIEAVREFKAMFAGDGKYSDGQILLAGRELAKAGEFAIALEAFDQVLARAKGSDLREPASVGRGQALCELGRYAEAVETLEKVAADNPLSGYTVAVSRGLCRAYSELGTQEADAEKRKLVFNKAVNAMKRARSFVKEEGRKAELDVETARLILNQAKAEAAHGDPARAREYTDKAIAAYQAVILFRNPMDPATRPHVEDAYVECMPLLIETERFDDAFEDAEKYLNLYPQGKYALQVRQYQTKARVSGSGSTVKDSPPVADGAAAGVAE